MFVKISRNLKAFLKLNLFHRMFYLQNFLFHALANSECRGYETCPEEQKLMACETFLHFDGKHNKNRK